MNILNEYIEYMAMSSLPLENFPSTIKKNIFFTPHSFVMQSRLRKNKRKDKMSIYNGNTNTAAGRTSSQRSIHEYPEHLNPFYEDENHKRLRFWKLGSQSKKAGRSNSFSIDSFKDFW